MIDAAWMGYRQGIAIVMGDTAYRLGRKVVFDTDTGQLMTLKVHKIRDSDWITGLSKEQYEEFCSTTKRLARIAHRVS